MQTPAMQYQDEWTTLRARLAYPSIESFTLGNFLGYIPDGYKTCEERILYVCPSTPGYMMPVFGKGANPLANDSLALSFARSLGGLSRGAADPLENVAITSVCKASPAGGEVSPSLLLVQQKLAVQTLRYELYCLQPALVVFACSGHFSALIRETVNASRGSAADFEKQGDGNGAMLFRKRGLHGGPAVLMVQPPSAFPESAQAPWLAQAAALLR